MDWDRYASVVSEYDRLTAYAQQVSMATVGIVLPEPHQRYGEMIFVKLLAHCITLRYLAPDPTRRNPQELWDIGSASAVARSIVEAYDAMAYIALGAVDMEERSFRILLWELHDVSRRIKILSAIGSSNPQYIDLLSKGETLKSRLKEHSHFARSSSSLPKKVNDGDPPPYYLSQRERCIAHSIDFDYYNAVTMKLSQYVHTLPFSVHQLMSFKAGSPEALHLMSLPLQYSLVFLSRAVEGMAALFPEIVPPPTKEVETSILVWSAIATRGVKMELMGADRNNTTLQ